MEDDGRKQSVEVRASRHACKTAATTAPSSPTPAEHEPLAASMSTPDTLRNAHAGICNGRHSDCVMAGQSGKEAEGVRHHAQVRLNGCEVDYQRLTSTIANDDLELQRHHRHIRRLMRETYGTLCCMCLYCALSL